MSSMEELMKNEEHQMIFDLEGQSDKHKCIALIKLKRYKEAVKYVTQPSYESSYIFYALKKYKRALKIVDQLDFSEKKVKILKSQILYYLGRYNEAYSLLSECEINEEVVVNLTAMKSLAELAHSTCKQIGTKYSVRKKDEMAKFKDLEKYKFSDKETEEEFLFNDSFKLLFNEKKYVEYLKTLSLNYSGILKEQFNNVVGNFQEINEENLSKGKKQTLMFNKRETSFLENPVHFQKGILPPKGIFWPNNEYFCFKKAKEMNYEIGDSILPKDSANLLFLNAFINVKKMIKGEKFTRKYFIKPADTFLWELIEVLGLKKEEFVESKRRIREILKKMSE